MQVKIIDLKALYTDAFGDQVYQVSIKLNKSFFEFKTSDDNNHITKKDIMEVFNMTEIDWNDLMSRLDMEYQNDAAERAWERNTRRAESGYAD